MPRLLHLALLVTLLPGCNLSGVSGNDDPTSEVPSEPDEMPGSDSAVPDPGLVATELRSLLVFGWDPAEGIVRYSPEATDEYFPSSLVLGLVAANGEFCLVIYDIDGLAVDPTPTGAHWRLVVPEGTPAISTCEEDGFSMAQYPGGSAEEYWSRQGWDFEILTTPKSVRLEQELLADGDSPDDYLAASQRSLDAWLDPGEFGDLVHAIGWSSDEARLDGTANRIKNPVLSVEDVVETPVGDLPAGVYQIGSFLRYRVPTMLPPN
ncbi:MAG: hypothetical protein AAF602_01790 [Myxococcota bacterium]